MARPFYDFWRQVLWSSTKTVCLIRLPYSLLGKSEIGNSDMALRIQKNVLRLEVPVYDVLLVERFNGANYFCCVQFCPRLIELLLLAQVCEELTAVQEVNEEVQLAFCLECVMQANYVGVLDLFQDVSFG